MLKTLRFSRDIETGGMETEKEREIERAREKKMNGETVNYKNVEILACFHNLFLILQFIQLLAYPFFSSGRLLGAPPEKYQEL